MPQNVSIHLAVVIQLRFYNWSTDRYGLDLHCGHSAALWYTRLSEFIGRVLEHLLIQFILLDLLWCTNYIQFMVVIQLWLNIWTTRTGPMIVMDFISSEKEMERLLNYIMIRVWIPCTSAGTFIDSIHFDAEDCVNPFHDSRKLHWFDSLWFWRLFEFIVRVTYQWFI